MTVSSIDLQHTYRKLVQLTTGANILGGVITFFFLAVLDPLPAGDASVRALEAGDIATFAISLVVVFASAFLLSRRLQRPIQQWQERLEAGAPAAEIPTHAARRIMDWPLINAALIAGLWFVSALFFAFYYANPGNFIGLAIGGAVTTAIVFFGADLLWRQIVPFFFPNGILSTVPAFRIWIERRLFLAFILIGAITPILLVILTITRSRLLLTAANPEAVLNNLIVVLLFVLVVGLATGVIVALLVARAIVAPIQDLRDAMERVEQNDFETRVQVTTNDEIGFLSERFNQMTRGLRQGERLHQLFALYVSPEVAQAAVETGTGLGGELVNCTIMFSDMRDFTSLTEQLPPEELVALINRYMTAMVACIDQYGGLVTRFGGDSILAVFGAPLNPMPDHAARAVAAGLAMRQALADFNQAEHSAGRPIVENGIGIATGSVIAGNVGGKERIEYTVMGDAANLASRLQDLTKELGYPILLSSQTYHALPEPPALAAEPLHNLSIKGKQEPVTVYPLG